MDDTRSPFTRRGAITLGLYGLAALEATRHGSWLAGERMTQADVAAGVMYDFVRLTVPELLPPGRYSDLDALAARYAELPAFAETQPEPG